MAEIQPNWNSYYSPQAYDTFKGNPGLDDLNKRYAQIEKDRELDRQLLGQQISKMNFGGVKPADVGDLQNQYNDILNAYQKARSITDPMKRAQLTMELRQKMNGLQYNVENKKENHSQELKMFEQMNHPNAFPADNAQQLVGDVIGTPTGSPEYQTKLEAFRNGWQDKPVDLGKLTTTAFTKNLTKSTNSGQEIKDPATGLFRNQIIKTSDVPKAAYTNEIVNSALGDKRTLHTISKLYPDLPPAQAVTQFANDSYEDQKRKLISDTTYSAPHMSYDQHLGLQENAARLKSKYPSFGQQQNLTPIYRQKLVGDMLNGVPGSGETLVNKLKADPSYQRPLGIKVNGDNIQFTIPDKLKNKIDSDGKPSWQVEVPTRVVTINKKDPNADVQLNELVNQLTGEKVDISSLRTQGGKKHVAVSVSSQPAKVTSQDEYNKVPKGTQYIAPDGKIYIKK